MNHRKTLLSIILVLSVLNCTAQRNEMRNSKIMDISKSVQFFHHTVNINFADLRKRLTYLPKKALYDLENAIAKKTLDNQILDYFYEKLSTKEIDELYNYYKSLSNANQTVLRGGDKVYISPALNKKRQKVFEKLFQKDLDKFKWVQKEFYRLDSVNYEFEKKKNKHSNIKKNKRYPQANGFYEVVTYNKQVTSYIDFIKSLKIKNKPYLDFKYVKEITKYLGENSFYYTVYVDFGKEKAEKLLTLTKHNIGKPLAIVVGGKIISAPYIHEPVSGGKVKIAGNLTLKKALEIVNKVKK